MIQFADRRAELEAMGDEIAELAIHLDVATYRLLVLLREFDARSGWSGGFRSCAHWLCWRTGIHLNAAREKLRVARALEHLPVLSASMQRGVLSYSKVRALTRVATPENEAQLHEVAMNGTAAHIERIVRGWRYIDRLDAAQKDETRHAGRRLSLFPQSDGSYEISGRLDPEVGAMLQRALELACEALYKDEPGNRPKWSQQRADAIGLLAELAMSGNAAARAERFQVVVHVDSHAEHGELDNGQHVSAETSRRIACDATKVIMTDGADGMPLSVGRRTRTVPPHIRRALDRRDHGCRFPGCGLRFCDAHHVQHWADGGVTSLENLVLLCRFHHRMLHEEGYTLEASGRNEFVFRRPDGERIAETPGREDIAGDAMEKLRQANARSGLTIDARTAPLWRGDKLDLDWTMRCLRWRKAG